MKGTAADPKSQDRTVSSVFKELREKKGRWRCSSPSWCDESSACWGCPYSCYEDDDSEGDQVTQV